MKVAVGATAHQRRESDSAPMPNEVIQRLRALADPCHIASMARLGAPKEATQDERFGVSITTLRHLAREIGRDAHLAATLWVQPIIEAKQLACLIEEPVTVGRKELTRRARDIQSWDVCDLFCQEVARRTDHLPAVAFDWVEDFTSMVRRAGWVSCAQMAIHRPAEWMGHMDQFRQRLHAWDGSVADTLERKAVSWAMRETAKRLGEARPLMVSISAAWAEGDQAGCRWVGRAVLKELERKGLDE